GGGPVGVDELRESRPGEPGVAALPLSVRQAELVGHDAVARRRPGRRRRGHPRLRRARLQDPGAALLRECGDLSPVWEQQRAPLRPPGVACDRHSTPRDAARLVAGDLLWDRYGSPPRRRRGHDRAYPDSWGLAFSTPSVRTGNRNQRDTRRAVRAPKRLRPFAFQYKESSNAET